MAHAASPHLSAKDFFIKLDKNSMDLVEEFYAPMATLEDPIGSITGAKKIRAYYAHQYEDLTYIHWDVKRQIIFERSEVIEWVMTIAHPNLKKGQRFNVPGTSIIDFDNQGKAAQHRDYFDMGAFVYEGIPGFGWIISLVKGRLKKGIEGAKE